MSKLTKHYAIGVLRLAREAIGVWAEKTLGLGEDDYFAGAGLLARQGSTYIFAVPNPERWQQVDGRIEAALTGIGGRVEPREGAMGCIAREARERLHVEVVIEDSGRTFVTAGGTFRCFVADGVPPPRPLFVMLLPETAGARKPFSLVVVYRGQMSGAPSPAGVSALVYAEERFLRGFDLGPLPAGTLRKEGVAFEERIPVPDDLMLRPCGTPAAFIRLLQRPGEWSGLGA